MNRNLLLFSVFLVLLGAGLGFYLLSIFGLILLIPAVMVPARPAPRPAPETEKQAPWRITPAAKPQPSPKPQPAAPQAQPEAPTSMTQVPSSVQQSTGLSYSPSLFPRAIFPSLSISGNAYAQPPAAPAKPAERDELIETGTMLALLKILLG